MTETLTEIDVAAPAATIFALAAATEEWPAILPHYDFVTVLARDGATKTVRMGARRGRIPIRWTAEQTDDAATPKILFHHVRGMTKGMDVEWRFAEIPGGTRVTIWHGLRFRFPVFADWLGEHVVGRMFIDHVARRTLARIKMLAERAAA